MKNRIGWMLGLWVCISAAPVRSEENLAEKIKAVAVENMKATQAEDEARTMATVHPKSPVYQSTKQMLKSVFERYDLRYSLKAFKFVAEDDGYAIARLTQTTEKVAGPDFRNNTIEMLVVYRKDSGRWKIWAQTILEVSYH